MGEISYKLRVASREDWLINPMKGGYTLTADKKVLVALGYKLEFKREFSI